MPDQPSPSVNQAINLANPYVGPRAFKTGESLYGRDREIQELLDLLIAERIVLLYSPSGAGKSSLVQAGLIPRLEKDGFTILPVARVNQTLPKIDLTLDPDEPTAAPSEANNQANASPNRYVLSALMSFEEMFPVERRLPLKTLVSLTLSEYLDHLVERAADRFGAVCDDELSAKCSTMLLFDQFEEILTIEPADREEKSAFFAQVGVALRDRNRWALFSMREDYIAALDPYLKLVPTRLRNTFRLDFLGAEAARQAIQKPADKLGIAFFDTASQRLVDDLRRVRIQKPDGAVEEQLGPYVEPVQLQVVCYRLWEGLPPDTTAIKPEHISGIGNVDTALADYYAGRVELIAQETEVNERAIREWVDQQLITEQGLRGQVLKGSEISGGLDNRAIALLENAHLVRAEKRGGATWYELAHDRLINPVRRDNLSWLEAHLSLLQRQVTLWNEQGRPDHLLLRGEALDEAEGWAIAHAREVTPVERSFLNECREIRAREEALQVKAEQEIKLAEQARNAALLRRRAYLLSAALVMTLIMSIVAIILGNQSKLNAEAAESNAMAAEANAGTAQAASTQAIAQQETAEAYSNLAISERATAESYSVLALNQSGTAQAASTQAVAQRIAAEKASDQANFQKSTAVAERNIAATAQAEAELQRGIALSGALAALSRNTLGRQNDLSLLLGIEAFLAADTVPARSAVLAGLQSELSRTTVQYGTALTQQGSWIYNVAFSPDGSKLAWSGTEGMLVMWDVNSQRVIWNKYTHGLKTVYAVAFSPDGKVLATGGGDGHILIWDTANGQLLFNLTTNHSLVIDLAFSPDGSLMASSGAGKVINLWNGATYNLQRSLAPLLGDAVWGLAWSPDSKQLAACSADRSVRIWDAKNGNEVKTLNGHEGRALSIAWSPDGKTLVSGGEDDEGEKDKLLLWWDIAAATSTVLTGHTDSVLTLAFSPDGKTLASGSADRTIILWNTRLLKPLDQLSNHTHWVKTLAFSPKGKVLLASGSFDRTVSIHELITQQELGTLIADTDQTINSLTFNPDGTLLMISGQSSGAELIHVNPPTSEKSVIHSLSGAYTAAALTKDGQTYAIGTESGKIRILDTQTGKVIKEIDTRAGPVLSLAFSQIGTLASAACTRADADLGVCTENTIYLWDVTTGALRSQLPPPATYTDQTANTLAFHSDSILSLAFNPDGTMLASGSRDQSILLWDIATSLPTASFLTLDSEAVTSLAFSPDGVTLASGSQNGEMTLWDVKTFQAIGEPFTGQGEALVSLSFNTDGTSLASGSAGGQVILWAASPITWIETACALVGRNLTETEWEKFLPEQEYHKTCEQWPSGRRHRPGSRPNG